MVLDTRTYQLGDDQTRNGNKASSNRCSRLPAGDASKPDAPPPPFASLQSIASEALGKCVAPRDAFAEELACSVALLARDAAMLDEKGVEKDIQRAAVAILLQVESSLVSPGKLRPLTQALLQALHGGKFDYATVQKLATDKLLTAGVDVAWSKLVDLVDTQAELSVEEALDLLSRIMRNCPQCVATIKALDANEIRELIRFLKSKDYGGATEQLMKILVDVASPLANDNEKKALVFVQRFATYTIDSIRAGSANESVSANFRSAAVTLIEAYSGLGIHRYSFTAGGILYPRFALRKASRPGRGSLDSVTYPSFDFVNLVFAPRFAFREWFYASLDASVFDPLGPFVELAVRSPDLNRKSDINVFLLGLVTPRLDLNVGIPALSKNVVVGGGIAARLYRAVTLGDGSKTYCRVGACDFPLEKDFNANNLEYSIFVKYVP